MHSGVEARLGERLRASGQPGDLRDDAPLAPSAPVRLLPVESQVLVRKSCCSELLKNLVQSVNFHLGVLEFYLGQVLYRKLLSFVLAAFIFPLFTLNHNFFFLRKLYKLVFWNEVFNHYLLLLLSFNLWFLLFLRLF